ncbi:MAG: ABC transporter permease [Pseudonocardia sp.]|nr:ABC transporter permease [Pseudonocardia sp.]
MAVETPSEARAAVLAVARAELRRRHRALLLVALVMGLAGGIVLGAVGLAERTVSAYPRLVDAVRLDDVRASVPSDQPRFAEAVPTLPGVAGSRHADLWVAQVEGGPALRFLGIGAGELAPADIATPVIVEGRAVDPAAADEVVVSEQIAADSGFAVGAELRLTLLTLEDVSHFDVGFTPHGPSATVRVVGIARMPSWGNALPHTLAGPAFAARYADTASARSYFLRLENPAGTAAFTAAHSRAEQAAAATEPSIVARYVPGSLAFPRLDVDPAVRTAEQALLVGLSLFALVVGLGGLQVVGQGLLRLGAEGRSAQRVEAVLGMTRGQRVAARTLAALPAALVAGVLGSAIASAAGVLEPLGSQARFEPAPGFRPLWGLAVGGGVALAALFLLMTAGATLLAARPRGIVAGSAPPSLPRTVLRTWARRWPAVLLGSRLAVHGRTARRGLPAMASILAAAAAVAGIVAAVTVGASLTRLVETPQRYAAGADLHLVDAREPDVAALVADPRVTALATTSSATLRTSDGRELGATAVDDRKGEPPLELASGRAPASSGEVAVGPRLADELGLGIGDVLAVRGPGGEQVPLTVTGTAVLPTGSSAALGEQLLLTADAMDLVQRSEPIRDAYIYTAPGTADAVYGELGQNLEIFPREVPESVRNLTDLVRLPELLALVLTLVAGTGLVHVLLTSARRHAREMAVFSVLGATPAQVRATLAVLAGSTVVPALVVGVPLGLGVARVLWHRIATTVGVAGDPAVPVGVIAAVAGVVLVGALLVAVVPGRRAARTSPALALAAG